MSGGKKKGKSEPSKAKKFASNLRALIGKVELTQQQAAEEIGVPLNWLRKACYDGVARIQASNEDRIERLRTFFRLPDADLLWQPSLPKLLEGFNMSYNEKELDLAIAGLTLAYRHNRDHLNVRKALAAIDKAVGIVAEEGQTLPSDRCEHCGKDLAKSEIKRGVCRECLSVGAAKLEIRAANLRAERTGRGGYCSD